MIELVRMNDKLWLRRKMLMDDHLSNVRFTDNYWRDRSKQLNTPIQTLKNDWSRRDAWKQYFLEYSCENIKQKLEEMLKRCELLVEQALKLSRSSKNDNAKVGAITAAGKLIQQFVDLAHGLGYVDLKAKGLELAGQICVKLDYGGIAPKDPKKFVEPEKLESNTS